MIFTEPRFLLFFAVVYAAYWAFDSRRAQKMLLLVASLVFYGAWDWRFLSLILVSTLIDYFASLGIEAADRASGRGEYHALRRARFWRRGRRGGGGERRRRAWLWLSLVGNLGLLGFFKYFGFFVDSAIDFAAGFGVDLHRPTLAIVLPVGISFYTFQTMSYTIDVYRRQLRARRSLLDIAVFVAFFPQLVAGPIVRARDFLWQLDADRVPFSSIPVRSYLLLFLSGFIKKACISDSIAPAIDPFFADPQSFTAPSAWLAMVLYSIQIYCDFSAYSDIAIAIAGLLGYRLELNFDFPYLARNIREFWRRWHMSLSTWLRDYLYVPLGGNRLGRSVTFRNIMVTMTLGGLWHGAAWHFVVWGALHGIALIVHRELERRRGARPPLLPALPAIVLTFGWTTLLWVFFRAVDLGSALDILRMMFLLESPGAISIDPTWWLLVALLALAHVITRRGMGQRLARAPLPGWAFAAGYGAAAALVLLFVRIDVQPFIYFQF
jgi:alginate O-acetyltransferase complex protein AlgI